MVTTNAPVRVFSPSIDREAQRAQRWNAGAMVALFALTVGCASSLVWLVHPYYEPRNDAALYVLVARALARGEGYSYLGMPFIVAPPGMSWLLTPLVAWRGTDFHALNLFVATFGVATIALFFVFTRERLGTLLALCVSIAVWLNPTFQSLCNQALSDVPGAAFFFACLLLERWTRRARTRDAGAVPAIVSLRHDVALGVCIALATYVRWVNVLLVPAIVVARSYEHWQALRSRSSLATANANLSWLRFLLMRIAPLACTTYLVLLPWSVRNSLDESTGPVDQNFLYSFSTSMWHVDGMDPNSARVPWSAVRARVPRHLREVLSNCGTRMRSGDAGPLLTITGGVMLAALLYVMLARREPAEIFAGGAIATMLVYVSLQTRHVLLVWLVVLPAVVESALALARRFASERVSRPFIAVLVLALALHDFSQRRTLERLEVANRNFAAFAADIAAHVPPKAKLATFIGWHHALFLDRPVYSLYFASARSGIMSDMEKVIDKYGIDTIVLADFVPQEQHLRKYFEEHYSDVQRIQTGTIFHVRP